MEVFLMTLALAAMVALPVTLFTYLAVMLSRRIRRGVDWWATALVSGREVATEQPRDELSDRRMARWLAAENAWAKWCFEHPNVDKEDPNARAWFMQAWNANRHRPGRVGSGT